MEGTQQMSGAARIRNIRERGTMAEDYAEYARPSVRRRVELPFFYLGPAVCEPKKMEDPYVRDHRWRGLGSFLERCFLCRKRLDPADDIFMYRDLRAFCSPECRQVVIDKEEASEEMLMARSAAKATSSVNHHIRNDNSNMKEWSNKFARGSGRAAA